MTNAGVMDYDYGGEVKVVLANLGDYTYIEWKNETRTHNSSSKTSSTWSYN